MRMPSTWSTVLSAAARRASVSRFPSPASTRRRVRSVSSNVMLPELPDAKIETRKLIVRSSTSPCNFASKQIFRMMAERWRGVNGVQLKTTLAGQAGTVEGEAVEGAEDRDGDQAGLEKLPWEGPALLVGERL